MFLIMMQIRRYYKKYIVIIMTKTGDETSLSMKVDDIPVPPSIYFGGCAFGAAFCEFTS